MKKDGTLTGLEKRFCKYYVLYYNGGLAAKKAGYKLKDDNNYYVKASELLRNPKIREYIKELEEEKLALIPEGSLKAELLSIAFMDRVGVIKCKSIEDIEALSDEEKKLIERVEYKDGVLTKIWLKSSDKAIERYISLMGWNAPTKSEVKLSTDVPESIENLSEKELLAKLKGNDGE